jgi:F420H(2)-dependent quinone reductase
MIPRPVLLVGWAIHRGLFRLSGGRLGTRRAGDGLGTLFITTTGRSSGMPRRNALYYLDDGDRLVVAASNAGAERDPGWWRNLRADPRATVDLLGERFEVRARRATPDEVDQLWSRFDAARPEFAGYRERAGRDVALVVLERVAPNLEEPAAG